MTENTQSSERELTPWQKHQGRNGANHPRAKAVRAVRDRQILDLYIKGVSFDELAEISRQKEWGVGKRRIKEIVRAATKRVIVDDKAREVLPVELAKLDQMEKEVNRTLTPGTKVYVEAKLRIMDRRAYYLGLRANEKKLAEAAQLSAAAQATMAKDFIALLDDVLDDLGVSFTERQRVPAIIASKMRARGLVTGDE